MNEPTNADLATMMRQHHEETHKRFQVLEHHLIDPLNPQNTLPMRVRDHAKAIEALQKGVHEAHAKIEGQAAATRRAVKKGVWAVITGGLGAVGVWLASKVTGTPHP